MDYCNVNNCLKYFGFGFTATKHQHMRASACLGRAACAVPVYEEERPVRGDLGISTWRHVRYVASHMSYGDVIHL